MKPVLQHDENRRRRNGGHFFEVAGYLPPLLPDRMLCGKDRSRRATGAISRIEA
jgi:hypothetical protein